MGRGERGERRSLGARARQVAVPPEQNASQRGRGHLLAIADSVAASLELEWIEVTPWDGVDRFDDLCATIPFGGDSARIAFSRLLLRKWMLSAP